MFAPAIFSVTGPSAESMCSVHLDLRFADDLAPALVFGLQQLAKRRVGHDLHFRALIEQLDLRDLIVVGASFGGWIAAEIATKTCERLSRLVLLGAVGAKFGERDKSDIVDIFATPRSRWEELSFRDPAVWLRDYESLPEEELTAMARNREATALFAWNPYMYNPKLKGRLHRIRIPTLVLWGAHDGFAPLAYGRSFCAAVPGAKFEEIAESGHFPHMEQPEAVARHVIGFASDRPRRRGDTR